MQLDGLYYNFYSKKKTYVTCVAGEIVAQGLATEPPREARAVKPRGKINLTCSQPSQGSTAKTLQHSPANIISPAKQAITYTFLTTFFKRETHAQYQPIVFPEIVLFHTQTRNNIITFLFTLRLNDFNSFALFQSHYQTMYIVHYHTQKETQGGIKL